jgi:hypothetical protein
MKMTGILKVDSGISQLNGTRLALQGESDPLTAATNFLANRGFGNNSSISLDGDNGFLGSVPVIFITSVGSAPFGLVATGSSKKSPAKKASRKGAKKPVAKKTVGNRATKKSTSQKSGKSSRKRQ